MISTHMGTPGRGKLAVPSLVLALVLVDLHLLVSTPCLFIQLFIQSLLKLLSVWSRL